MTLPQVIILGAWFVLPVSAVVFILVLGRPRRYRDRTMFWHLLLTTGIAGAEPVAFLIARLSLWPAAIINVGSVVVLNWRTVWLVRQRQRIKQTRKV